MSHESIKRTLRTLTQDFTGLFYPNLCIGCEKNLYRKQEGLCLHCLMQLPRTDYHHIRGNAIEKKFYGKADIQHATAYLYFEKEGISQKILHSIKYRGKKELGEEIGRYFGADLAKSRFSEVDAVIPVPLHPSRLKKRGYNQSECIAKGIADAMNKPLHTGILSRIIENPTQTSKDVYQRWENANGIFGCTDTEPVKNLHLLLVDDVLTTGSTLEACIASLQKAEGIQVSVATLAAAI